MLRDGAGHPARMGEAPDGVTPVESPATEHYGPRSRTNTPQVPFVSPGTRWIGVTLERHVPPVGREPGGRTAAVDAKRPRRSILLQPQAVEPARRKPTKPLLGAGTLHWP